MVNTPDVSVLIPAYNAASTLEAAVRSALAQDGINVEVCVCVNGCTDDTQEVAERLAAECPQVRTNVLQANRGAAGGMNGAAVIASGRYFIELDADDWYTEHSLRALVQALDACPSIGFVYGDTQFHGKNTQLYTAPAFFREMYWKGNLSMYGFMYRREAWDAGCRYGDLMYAPDVGYLHLQDWDMQLQLTEHMRYTGLHVPGVVLHVNYTDSGVTSKSAPYRAAMLAMFKRRWQMVTAEGC